MEISARREECPACGARAFARVLVFADSLQFAVEQQGAGQAQWQYGDAPGKLEARACRGCGHLQMFLPPSLRLLLERPTHEIDPVTGEPPLSAFKSPEELAIELSEDEPPSGEELVRRAFKHPWQ